MSDLEKSLLPGETIRYRTRAHWIVVVLPSFGALLLGMFGFAMWLTSRSPLSVQDGSQANRVKVASFFLCGAALCLAGAFSKRFSPELAVNNERVLARRGFLFRKAFEVPLSWFGTLTVDQDLLGRTLGYGTITLREEKFPQMAHPLEFTRQVHAARQEKNPG